VRAVPERRWPALSVVLVAGAVALTGCGGGGDSTTTSTTGGAATIASTAGSATTADTTTAAAVTPAAYEDQLRALCEQRAVGMVPRTRGLRHALSGHDDAKTQAAFSSYARLYQRYTAKLKALPAPAGQTSQDALFALYDRTSDGYVAVAKRLKAGDDQGATAARLAVGRLAARREASATALGAAACGTP
jgi:hypothetical protein